MYLWSAVGGSESTLHKMDAPFAEGASRDDGVDMKRCSSMRRSLTSGLGMPVGKAVMNSASARAFLLLGVENESENSWSIPIQRANLPLMIRCPKIYCMGLELATTLVLRSRIKWRSFWTQCTTARASFSS